MATNYDSIAGSYDFLSRLVFGRSLVDAQLCLLPYIPAGSRILVAGGGTGWILESIADIYPDGLHIDYVDSSERMLTIAMKRNYKGNTVSFIHQPIENYSASPLYDVIITPFLFDNFTEEKAHTVFLKLNDLLRSNGLWLYTDYVSTVQGPFWQKLLLWTMYFFFRMVSHVEAKRMTEMSKYFGQSYKVEFETSHYSGFISSIAYRKM
ncbi:MAG: Methyltransferase type 12 [Bacteroidetes bacterium]|nr:Methyltransferase type 12 [Bacteroidota bacterium]